MEKYILIVDDDPVHVKLVEEIVRGQGYQPISTTEAADGLQIAIDRKPNLILLDVMIPVINGYNFCKLIKTENNLKDIPIVLLTSRTHEDDRKIGFEAGAEAYLTKPIDTKLLIEAIEKYIRP